jgi:Flp pilus assembly protein TadB
VREDQVTADEIFVLLLVVVCVGFVAAAAFHSRSRDKASDAEHSQIEDKTLTSPSSEVAEDRAEPRHHRKKQRR